MKFAVKITLGMSRAKLSPRYGGSSSVKYGLQIWRAAANISGVPRNFVRGGVQQIQLRTEDRENGDLGGGSPLVRGSGGSCNLVQVISFLIVKFS